MPATSIIDRSKLDAAYKGFQTLFDMQFQNTAVITDELATVVNSTGAEEVYNWMGPQPKMREWIGDRRMDQLRAYDWTVKNKDWANGIEVEANDIRDDRLDMVRPRIQALASMAARHEEELLINLMIAGFTTTCYDGQYFFDVDHKDGNGPTQTNKGTAALSSTEFDNAVTAMMGILDENSEPMYIQPTHLIVGPKLRSTARAIVQLERLASGADNPNFNAVKLVISQRLTGVSDDYWFLLAHGGPVKSLVLQRREAVEFVAQDDPSSEGYFNRKKFRYGANWRGNAAYGLWQFAWGAIL